MIRRPPRSTPLYSSAASDVYKRQDQNPEIAADGTVLRTTPAIGFEYEDETASSFEIGGKHTLMDGAMTLNWAMFNSEYVDQQVSTFVGLGFVVANAASSDIQGVAVSYTHLRAHET